MNVTSKLVDGDALKPLSTDMVAQWVSLPIGQHPGSRGDERAGWRIMTGNERTNLWARLAYRYECE